MLTVKKQDDELIYNALKLCGNLSDVNFNQLKLNIKQTEAKGILDKDIYRNIMELCPILLDGTEVDFSWDKFELVLRAKEPLINALADISFPKLSEEVKRDFHDKLEEWTRRLFG